MASARPDRDSILGWTLAWLELSPGRNGVCESFQRVDLGVTAGLAAASRGDELPGRWHGSAAGRRAPRPRVGTVTTSGGGPQRPPRTPARWSLRSPSERVGSAAGRRAPRPRVETVRPAEGARKGSQERESERPYRGRSPGYSVQRPGERTPGLGTGRQTRGGSPGRPPSHGKAWPIALPQSPDRG